jgi:putative addiction module component (TIGR02574 family)
MSSPNIEEIVKLSVAERIELVEDIWDSIAATPDSLPVTDAQRQELDRRLADYRDHPDDVRSWQRVRSSLTKKR